jgi:hypothetical protein
VGRAAALSARGFASHGEISVRLVRGNYTSRWLDVRC